MALRSIVECRALPDGSDMKVPCLFDHKNEVTDSNCYEYLNLVGEIILSDYRLVHNFINQCQVDIEKFKCGRISTNKLNSDKMEVASQGETIKCLAMRIEKLSPSCAHQIFRISELQSEDYHLDRPLYYACREDRELICADVVAGKGRVFDCLMQNKFEDKMSKGCRESLTERQRLRSHNYRADFKLTKSCKGEIGAGGCDISGNNDVVSLSSLLVCLEKSKRNLQFSSACIVQLKAVRKQLIEDYRLTPEILLRCQHPIETFCSKYIYDRRGGVLHCLMGLQRSVRQNVSQDCTHAIHDLIKVTDVVEDVRVDPVIRRACSHILFTRCSPSVIREDDVYACLLSNREDPEMNEECLNHLFELEFFVSRDITLEGSLYEACSRDAEQLCQFSGGRWSQHRLVDSRLATCLWNHRHPHPPRKLTGGGVVEGTLSGPCLREVANLMLTRASSVDLNPEVFQACLGDLGNFCSPVPGKVGVEEDDEAGVDGMACLEDHLDELQSVCREAVVHFARDVMEEPGLDRRIAASCRAAERRYCAEVPRAIKLLSRGATVVSDDDDGSRDPMFECLVRHRNDLDMETDCRAALEHFLIISQRDLRLSPGFSKDCHTSLVRFCPAVVVSTSSPQEEQQRPNPVVVSKTSAVMCLSRRLLEQRLLIGGSSSAGEYSGVLLPEACARHLQFELLTRSESLSLDPALANACEEDRKLLCGRVPEGYGEALECLRAHRDSLSPGCQQEVFVRDQVAMAEAEADYKLVSTCASMIHSHCMATRRNSIHLRECLLEKASELGDLFDAPCRHIVMERFRRQRSDYRLNPRLNVNCRLDIRQFCKDETSPLNYGDDGNVVTCLQRKFIRDATASSSTSSPPPLSPACTKYIRQLLISENLNHRLDPTLSEFCYGDLRQHCAHELAISGPDGENSDGGVVECLRRRVVGPTSVKNDSCAEEVLRLSLAGKADIGIDPVLAKACAGSLESICSKTFHGDGRQMRCLLEAMDQKKTALEDSCRKSLQLRRELWEISAQITDARDWRIIASELNASHSRNLIFGVLFTVLMAIFIIGLCCGRWTRRVVTVNMKNQ